MIKTGMGIFKVRYNDNEKRDYITHLLAGKISSDDGETINKGVEAYVWTKEQIISFVDGAAKTSVFTIVKSGEMYLVGDQVETYSEGDNVYLRTKGNSKKEDNLGSLETF